MTSINGARRAFLKGDPKGSGTRHHMPWAMDAFLELCRRCDDCIRACAEAVLVAGDGGYPTVDFARGGCSFCGACAAACRFDALDAARTPAWSLRVAIDDSCLSARGITCRACGDACERRAIRFRLQVGGRAVPAVEPTQCNGCGSCIATCPIQVIQIKEAA